MSPLAEQIATPQLELIPLRPLDADETEEWHNWIVRRRPESEAIGFVQATIVGTQGPADIAWVIGVLWHGRGFATEAAQALVAWLERGGVSLITAHVHPDHHASAAVAARGGLEPSDQIEDGERVWRRIGVESDRGR